MKFNWVRWLCACMFMIEANLHFHNWWVWPKTDAELITDGITMLILALAFESKKVRKL